MEGIFNASKYAMERISNALKAIKIFLNIHSGPTKRIKDTENNAGKVVNS